MARTETDFGGGIDKVFDNDFITRKELEDILKQRATTDRFYELEPLEVLDIFREGSKVSQPGAVIGRYVYSEQGDSVDECLEYLPLDSNIQQQAIVGEVYFGLSFKGQRYYFGRIAKNTEEVNSQDFNISGLNDNTSIVGENTKVLNSDNVGKSAFKQGDTFVNDNPSRLLFSEGDTMIEGRFKNSIRLGNDDKLNSGNIKIVAGCQTGIEDLTLDKSSLYLTTDEDVAGFTKPQLYLNSERITLNSTSDDIIVSGSNDVNIFGENNISITNNSGDGDIRIGNAKAQDLTIVSQRQRIISLRSTQINSSNGKIEIGGGRDLPPAVLGNEDFIKVVDIILNQQIQNNLIEIGEQVASPAPNATLIAQLTEENVDLNRIKNDRTYLSKKASIE
jgi:hypothetical protein|tara:strand:+ start:42 stop:1214 length:1173 start_codon:yes stop_codon:yes gene_type:complete